MRGDRGREPRVGVPVEELWPEGGDGDLAEGAIGSGIVGHGQDGEAVRVGGARHPAGDRRPRRPVAGSTNELQLAWSEVPVRIRKVLARATVSCSTSVRDTRISCSASSSVHIGRIGWVEVCAPNANASPSARISALDSAWRGTLLSARARSTSAARTAFETRLSSPGSKLGNDHQKGCSLAMIPEHRNTVGTTPNAAKT